MRASEILQRLCGESRGLVHATRYEAVLAATEALLRAQRLSITAVGRELSVGTQPRYGIKRVDRLVGNPRLHAELEVWYAGVASSMLPRSVRRVIVLIDWTQLHGNHWALAATVAFDGRALPILVRSYLKHQVSNRFVEAAFLRELRRIIPPTCAPVIVADAGFRSPFFRACEAVGFDYVVRLRNDNGTVDAGKGASIKFADLFARASTKASCIGSVRPYASSHAACWGPRVVLGPKPPKAASRVKYPNDYERRRGCEPFLLATSLNNESASSVVAIYAKRMQIEETFRDTKSSRFGWAFSHAGSRSKARLDVLLFVSCLAMNAVMLLGAAAERKGLDRNLRASSVKRRVLSLFRLGNLALRYAIHAIGMRDILVSLRRIALVQRFAFPPITWPSSQGRTLAGPLPHGLFCMDCGFRGPEHGWPT